MAILFNYTINVSGSGGGVGPYTDGTYYYVFVNKVNLWFDNIKNYIGNPPSPIPNRHHADNLSYDLYQKPNSSNQGGWRTTYTYLTSSLNPNGNVTNCNQFVNFPTCYNDLYAERKQGSGKWLTTVNVTVTNGYASFSFPDGGTSSYITYPEDRGGAGFYTASLINGGWIP